jgi:pilus assembly protein CpaE
MINILIAGKYSDSVERIQNLVKGQPDEMQIVGIAQDEKTAMESIDRLNPDAVIITMDTGDSELTQIAQKIYIYKPRIITVVYGTNIDNHLYRELIDTGVRYAGEYPETAADLSETLKRLITMETERAGYMKQQHTALLTSCMTIGFYSPKSGAGTTTCALNLAAGLAKDGKKVILIDLDLAFGDIASGFDMQPDKTIAELCAEITSDSVSITDIESYAQIHSSGVRILAAPKSPEFAEKVTIPTLKAILATLKVYYEYIILDLPAGFEDKHADYFAMVNRIYFVTQLQLSCIAAAKRAINLISILGKKESTSIIVNRQGPTDIVTLHDVHSILNCRVVLIVPSDFKTVSNAANRGIPVVVAYPHSGVAKAFDNLVIYTKSKDKTLDVWDMSAKEAAKEYKALNAGGSKAKPGKKERHGFFFGRKKRK